MNKPFLQVDWYIKIFRKAKNGKNLNELNLAEIINENTSFCHFIVNFEQFHHTAVVSMLTLGRFSSLK